MTIELEKFLEESLKIEGIIRSPMPHEVAATIKFLDEQTLSVAGVVSLVAAYAPYARLRDREGLDVSVGNHVPPAGGPMIRDRLRELLAQINAGKLDAYEAHQRYEDLHPFTDGNGRSGRTIWLWQTLDVSLGFLHRWYYQSLARGR